MLIRAIRAENFMRFSRVEIENLPSGGLIGVEGPNESGKTTLGELLLFAFFGRPRAVVESPVLGLIRWGTEAMSVEVEFSVQPLACTPGKDGAEPETSTDFLLFRQVDRSGTNFVRIIEMPERKDVASGNVQVAEFLAQRIGFDGAEFQQSFYHDQYEIRRVQTAQVAFFESATGVKHLQDTVGGIRRELEPLEREFSFFQKEIARNLSQIEKYERNVVKLLDLGERKETVERQVEETKSRLADVKGQLEALRSEASSIQERSARAGGLLDLSADEFRQTTGELMETENGAAATREAIGDEDRARVEEAAIRAGLEKMVAVSDGVAALRDRIREELRDVTRQQEEPSDGTAARIREEEQKVAREGRLFRRNLLLFTLLLLPLAGLATWLVLSGHVYLRAGPDDALLAPLPAWLRPHVPWALWGVAVLLPLLTLLHLALAVRRWRRRRTAREELKTLVARDDRLSREATRFKGLLEINVARDFARLVREAGADENTSIAGLAKELSSKHEELLEETGMTGLVESLTHSHKELCSRIAETTPKLEKRLQQNESARKKLQGDRSRVLNEIRECESQAAKKSALEERNAELEASASEIRGEIDCRLLASSLLDETAATLRGKVGPTLTRFVKSALPRLTAGRYRDVRVENDLEVKVFSSEKNDFLSIHELSGGTNEALSLALRLAVSQALVTSRAKQSQFVFLDEPFKMMDSERIVETLKILRGLSPDLCQFFLIQPEFSEEQRRAFDLVIRTTRDDVSLALGT